jgi:ParB-like chromosome segregation protein Spo0J
VEKMVKLSSITENPTNPRYIKDDRFKSLCKSVKEFADKMMPLRPIVIDRERIIVAGNMRYKALIHNGVTEVPDNWIKTTDDMTADEVRRFIMVDNLPFGDWDWGELEQKWDAEELEDWGLELDFGQKIDKMEDGDIVEAEKSVQIEPPKEYILIMAESNSEEWEEIKERLQLKMVRRGGYKKGSPFGCVGLERVIWWNDFKERINVNSSSK